jgi:outer membrane immunogenic protein
MKKLFFLICLLPMLAQYGHAQDEGARQDINLSFMGVIQPYVEKGSAPYTQQKSTLGPGLYVGYRYLLTPNGALEANYSYSRFTNKFFTVSQNARVLTSMQEATFAYVRYFDYKRFNPFLEGGGGLEFFSPLGSIKTTSYDTELTKSLTVLFGGGVAYELNPSWDLRVQYRGQIFTPNDFGLKYFSIGRRYIMSQPAIGLAYHF